MNYQEAKGAQSSLNKIVDKASNILNTKYTQKNELGMVIESVRMSAGYQADRRAFDTAFSKLRLFNSAFMKTFKKEIRAERSLKYV